MPYEFNQSDLNACCLFLQKHLLEMEAKKSKDVTWTTVRYMISEIQYGGRITDDWDRLQMNVFAEKFFRQEVRTELDGPASISQVFWTRAHNRVTPQQGHGDQTQKLRSNEISNQVLDPGYEFLKGYSIPAGTDVNVFRRHIDENLPAVDVPEVVGLNQNADLTYRLQQVRSRGKMAVSRSSLVTGNECRVSCMTFCDACTTE